MANSYRNLAEVQISNYLLFSNRFSQTGNVLALEILKQTIESKKEEIRKGIPNTVRSSKDVKTLPEFAKYVVEKYVNDYIYIDENIGLINAMEEFSRTCAEQLEKSKRHSEINPKKVIELPTEKEEVKLLEEESPKLLEESKPALIETKETPKVANLDTMYGQTRYEQKYVYLIAKQPKEIKEKLLEDSPMQLRREVEKAEEKLKKQKLEELKENQIREQKGL